jgi:hypothetical protein
MQVMPLTDAQRANVEKLPTDDTVGVVDEDSTAVSQRHQMGEALTPQQRQKLIVLEDYSLVQYKLAVPFFKVIFLE